MINYYLKGFKLGFQPERDTAKLVYQSIVKREPDFLQKQVPKGLSTKEQENFGRYEGEFLSDEIVVKHQKVEFSDLAQELLFGKAPKEVKVTQVTKPKPIKEKPKKKQQTVIADMPKAKAKTKAPEDEKEDESLWEL